MADPFTALGAAAAVTQIAGQIITIAVTLSRFYDDVKEAPEAVRQQLLHVEQLSRLAQLVRKNRALQTLAVISALENCEQVMNKIIDALQKVSQESGDRTLEKYKKAVLAALKKNDLSKWYEELERHKSTLVLAIHVVDSGLLRTINITMTRIEQGVSRISMEVYDTNLNVKTIINTVPVLSKGITEVNTTLVSIDGTLSKIDDNISTVSLNMSTMDGKISKVHRDIPELKNLLESIYQDIQGLKIQSNVQNTRAGTQKFFKFPNRRAPTFLGRQSVIDTLDQILLAASTDGPRIAVVRGMGGQGKTQIALQYCFKKKANPFFAVFWIDATTEASARGSMTSIYETITSPASVLTNDAAKMDYVLNYFGHASEPWLLVFDNYDKMDYLVTDFFPESNLGAILVTSRSAATRDLVSDEEGYIELQGLPEEAAVDLLYRLSNNKRSDSTREAASAIVRRLGQHALAITQAATYIKKQRLPLSKFLEHYESRRRVILETIPNLDPYRRILNPIDKEMALNSADKEIALSVFTTWELSFQQLNGESLEVKLLTILAYFDNQDISERIFRDGKEKWYGNISDKNVGANGESGYAEETEGVSGGGASEVNSNEEVESNEEVHTDEELDQAEDNEEDEELVDENDFSAESKKLVKWLHQFKVNGEWDTDYFCDVVEKLTETSLVQSWERRDDLIHITIHPLVKDWIRLRVCSLGDDKNITTAWLLLGSMFYENFDNRRNQYKFPVTTQQEMMRHVQSLAQTLSNTHMVVESAALDLAKASYWCGSFMYSLSQYTSVEKLSRYSFRVFKSRFVSTDWWIRKTQANLAYCLLELGKLEEAQELQEAHLKTTVEVWRLDHKNTLRSALGLAHHLTELGQLETAEAQLRDLLARAEIILGIGNGLVLDICNEIGNCLRERKLYREAEVFHRRAWLGQVKLHAPCHVDSLIYLTNLALTLDDLGVYDEALDMLNEAVSGFDKAVGSTHPDYVWAMSCRGSIAWKKQFHDKLEMIIQRDSYEEALAFCDKTQEEYKHYGDDWWGISWIDEQRERVLKKMEKVEAEIDTEAGHIETCQPEDETKVASGEVEDGATTPAMISGGGENHRIDEAHHLDEHDHSRLGHIISTDKEHETK